MEILKKFRNIREGNECLLVDYIILVSLGPELYTVIHVDTVRGSWTGNYSNISGKTFADYKSAADYMNDFINKNYEGADRYV